MNRIPLWAPLLALILAGTQATAQLVPTVPPEKRGRSDAERSGFHDANNIRTVFWNYGMVGDYPADPIGVDLSTFHSAEVPKGSGINYSDGITPFVLTQIIQPGNDTVWIMETGYRERQGRSPRFNRIMRFEPRPGYFQADPAVNRGRAPALSNDPRTWPATWPDKDNTWDGTWNGYFGKRPAADLESFTVMDDDFYDAWNFYPDSRDTTRKGLGLRIEVRGFQWANPQAGNVVFWHYDITNEGTTDFPAPGQPENIIFGIYMDSGVGGSAIGCDPVPESDDDNAFYDKSLGLNLVYTWDNYGHGRGLNQNCATTGYLGYAYLETPGKPFDLLDNDNDGITDEKRDGGEGQLIEGQAAIRAYAAARYDLRRFEAFFGRIEDRPAYRVGKWWTGDEDMDWTEEFHDFGEDGVANTNDRGEGDGRPTNGETSFDKTDVNESDQIGLTGFKFNRIRSVQGGEVDGIVFYTDQFRWPERLYKKFSARDSVTRFDPPLVSNYNIGFLFASGPFTLKAGKTERFSLALAYGADLFELRNTVKVVQAIYNSNYQFAVPPPSPVVSAEAGDGYVRLTWNDEAERSNDPVTFQNDFEGYRIYRSTDPDFRDPKVIVTGRGTNTIGNGKPIAQFDKIDGVLGYSDITVEGVAYWLGSETGITHSWTDSTVTNGQQYYYAVTAYDFGSSIPLAPGDTFKFYPSENAITVSRTLRGGLVLARNTVAVRPNPKVLGYQPAGVSEAVRFAGGGVGNVTVRVVNSGEVPDNHVFKVAFTGSPSRIPAESYIMIDTTTRDTVFKTGVDFSGTGKGISGKGLLPVVSSPGEIYIDTTLSRFRPGFRTNARLAVEYGNPPYFTKETRRFGFPDDITITFSNAVLDTSLEVFPYSAIPVKFRIVAHTPQGDRRLPFVFFDLNNDSTLSAAGAAEEIQVLTGPDTGYGLFRSTWKVRLAQNTPDIITPATGDVYDLIIQEPLQPGDEFLFTSRGAMVAPDAAKSQFPNSPYVVPNPYVGAASFEPDPFGVQGRGDRRMEFRGLPQSCTIRIYTVRGELVQSLWHDGTADGYVAWDLRTKDNMDVAPGLYIYHVDAGSVGTHIGKFAIIK